jgi:hypothetical protein
MNRAELTRGLYIVLIAAALVVSGAAFLAFGLPAPEWALEGETAAPSFLEILLSVSAVGAVGAVGSIVLMAIGTRLFNRWSESRRRQESFRRMGGPSWSERITRDTSTETLIATADRPFSLSLFRRLRRRPSVSQESGEPIDLASRRGARLLTVAGIFLGIIALIGLSNAGNSSGESASPTPAVVASPTPSPTPAAVASPTPAPSTDPSSSPEPTPSPSPSETPASSVTPAPTATPTPSATPKPTVKPVTSYVVRSGDTIRSIACKLPIGCAGWEELARVNSIMAPDYALTIGDLLLVP